MRCYKKEKEKERKKEKEVERRKEKKEKKEIQKPSAGTTEANWIWGGGGVMCGGWGGGQGRGW